MLPDQVLRYPIPGECDTLQRLKPRSFCRTHDLNRVYVKRHGCVPPGTSQNINRRVVVSVHAETAVALNPSGGQVEVLRNRTATRTAFRRIRGVYEGSHTSGTCSLVREVLPKHRPTAVENAFAEVLVSRHVANAQIFQRDTVILLHEISAEFMREVAALVVISAEMPTSMPTTRPVSDSGILCDTSQTTAIYHLPALWMTRKVFGVPSMCLCQRTGTRPIPVICSLRPSTFQPLPYSFSPKL